MQKLIVSIVVLIAVIWGVYYFVFSNTVSAPVTIPAYSDTSTSQAQNQEQNSEVTNTPAVDSQTFSQPNSNVEIKNFSFGPSSLSIKVETKVVWTNNDSAPHTITSDSNDILNSSTLSSGESFSFTFTKAGVFNYHCNIHPMMKGSITVSN